jgi:hypothetical protein
VLDGINLILDTAWNANWFLFIAVLRLQKNKQRGRENPFHSESLGCWRVAITLPDEVVFSLDFFGKNNSYKLQKRCNLNVPNH